MKGLVFAVALISACSDAPSDSETDARKPVFSSARWAVEMGGARFDTGVAVAVDSAGDVVAAGTFDGTVSFGKTQSAATRGVWISKRSAADGSEVWTQQIAQPLSGSIGVRDVATVPGGVLVLGTYSGELPFGDTRLSPAPDCFILKLSSAGAIEWARNLGGEAQAVCEVLAASSDGSYFAVQGAYKGTLRLPSGDVLASHQDLFLIAFDPDGQIRWATTNQNPDPVVMGMTSGGLVITTDGDLVMSGAIGFPMVFNRAVLDPDVRPNQYLARFSRHGQMMWARVIGDTEELRGAGPIAIDPKGGAAVTSERSMQLGIDGVPAVERFDPAGGRTWERRFGFVRAGQQVITTLGDVVVTGAKSQTSRVELGAGTVEGCHYLVAQDAEGRVMDAIGYEDRDACGSRWFEDLASGPGTLVWTGSARAGIDVGTGTLPFAGESDAVIVMVDTVE